MNEYREHWLKTYEEHRQWAEHLKSWKGCSSENKKT